MLKASLVPENPKHRPKASARIKDTDNSGDFEGCEELKGHCSRTHETVDAEPAFGWMATEGDIRCLL